MRIRESAASSYAASIQSSTRCRSDVNSFPELRRCYAKTNLLQAATDLGTLHIGGAVSHQPPNSLLSMLPPLAQNTSATPISEPPATTPDATGKVNSSATFGFRLSTASAMTAPRKNRSP